MMIQRVDSKGINFHFEQRTKSTIDLSAAMQVLAQIGDMSLDSAHLLRHVATQLHDEATSDQMLLALWRLSMMTCAGEALVELPAEWSNLVITAADPRPHRSS